MSSTRPPQSTTCSPKRSVSVSSSNVVSSTPARVAPIARGVRERGLLGLAGLVGRHRDERGHAAALLVGAAHEVAGTLRRDHPHVDALRRRDLAEVDVEPVRERERVALLEVGLDVFLVDARLLGVGEQHHDHVGFLARVGGGEHPQPGLLGLGPRRRTLAEADAHVDAGVLHVAARARGPASRSRGPRPCGPRAGRDRRRRRSRWSQAQQISWSLWKCGEQFVRRRGS